MCRGGGGEGGLRSINNKQHFCGLPEYYACFKVFRGLGADEAIESASHIIARNCFITVDLFII